MPQITLCTTRIGITLLLFFIPILAIGQKNPLSSPTTQVVVSNRIAWEGKPKITRYRLQLARNEDFSDIVFDKVVEGREYKVTEISPGKYFWRVAPAARETGAYSKPLSVLISVEGAVDLPTTFNPPVLSPPKDVGWGTATGLIDQPLAARLRGGPGFDLVGVNSYGMVYALNGENGVALWSARYRPGARKGEPVNSDASQPFAPLLIQTKDKPVNVLVAFDGGIRSLDGPTGRELWRAALPGEALAGLAFNDDSEELTAIALFDNTRTLSFIKGGSGQIVSQTKLEGLVVGRPVALAVKNEPGVLIALNNGTLEVRNMTGVRTLAIRLDSLITTGPLLVRASQGQLVMLGTEVGLVALNSTDLTPLWRVATVSDAPQGLLSSADLDGDGTEEVLMVTRRGRVVAVNIATGKIKWHAEGASDAMRAAFADLNGDGVLDVLVPGGTAFALGFSGKDGKLIWKAEDNATNHPGTATATAPRMLVAALLGSGELPLLVGADTGRTSLRAVGLPVGSVK